MTWSKKFVSGFFTNFPRSHRSNLNDVLQSPAKARDHMNIYLGSNNSALSKESIQTTFRNPGWTKLCSMLQHKLGITPAVCRRGLKIATWVSVVLSRTYVKIIMRITKAEWRNIYKFIVRRSHKSPSHCTIDIYICVCRMSINKTRTIFNIRMWMSTVVVKWS